MTTWLKDNSAAAPATWLGVNLGAAGGGVTPDIDQVIDHNADGTVRIITVSPYSTPVPSVMYNGNMYEILTEFDEDEIRATTTFDGPYGVLADMVYTDFNGESAPFSVTKNPKIGWAYETTTLDDAALPTNSIFVGLGSASSDQITYQETVAGETIDVDADGVIQTEIPIGVYPTPAHVLDSSSNFVDTGAQTINLTIANNIPNSVSLPPVTDGIDGVSYQFVFDLDGQDAGTTCWITAGDGVLSNDGSVWDVEPIPFSSTSQLRITVVAGATGTATNTASVNNVEFSASVSTNAVNTPPLFDAPAYDNAPTYPANSSVTFTPNLVTQGDPLGLFSLQAGVLPGTLTLNTTTGVISGDMPSSVTSGSFTIRVSNASGDSDAVINWETTLPVKISELISSTPPPTNTPVINTQLEFYGQTVGGVETAYELATTTGAGIANLIGAQWTAGDWVVSVRDPAGSPDEDLAVFTATVA